MIKINQSRNIIQLLKVWQAFSSRVAPPSGEPQGVNLHQKSDETILVLEGFEE